MDYEVSSGQTSNGISLAGDNMYVFNGGTANSTAVNEAGGMFVEAGGVANSTTVNESGNMSVAGVANKTVLNGSGYWGLGEMNVHDGGVANSTTINSGGSMRVDKGGTANSTTVNDCGSMHVFNGGVANSTAVSSGGSVYVDEGATVAEVTVKDGGVLDIRKGGAAVSIREEGGYVNVAEGANAVFTANSFKDLQLLNDSATLHSGTTANATTVDDFGKLYVYAGGTANSTSVNSGGNLYVSSGGTADATIVNDFGSMYVFNGGTANSTSVNSDGSAYVDKGGTMNAAIVNEGGDLHVSGTVNETTVNGADELNCGELYIHGGGSASATVVNSFGWMRIDEKGAANGITVNSCANLVVSTGGVATAIRENGGYVDVADGANVTFANNEFSGLTLSAGSATVHAGTTAKSTTVFTSGELYVYSGGTADGTVLTGTDRWECAELYIYEGGTANLTAVNNGGWLYVGKGGTAGATTVNAGGYLGIAAGGMHTGTLTIAEDAVVSAYAGSILDFDISAAASGNAAQINDLSRIQGMPDYSLTVSTSQVSGEYHLAGGAAGFSKTITVKDTDGSDLGTLRIGETVYIGSDTYTLGLTDDILTVTVQAPTIVDPDGDVRLANTMPQARYMYGCCPTSVAMLLGYYDLYGYRGRDFSAMIDGDVDVYSRGSGDEIYVMDDFDSNLGRATATKGYVYRFFSHDPIEIIIEDVDKATPTTPAEELPYSFVNGGEGPEIRTDVWECLADYLGTAQFWRDCDDWLETGYRPDTMLEQWLYDDSTETITDPATQTSREIMERYEDFQYGLYLYVQDKGYSMDMKVTGTHQADVAGGDFTFEDYMREIDAGRPALIIIDGHIMTGYGYNAETKEIIFDDCYEEGRMAWDGTYDFADDDRELIAIATVGFITTDDVVDLAVTPVEGSSEQLVLAVSEGKLASDDYCFVGSPLYLSFAVSNLSEFASGPFDVLIGIDGYDVETLPSDSLAGGESIVKKDLLLGTELGIGLHQVEVYADSGNRIQEEHALNNLGSQSIMVLEEGTNVVEGIRTVGPGEVSGNDYVMNGAELHVLDGGTAEWTLIQGKILELSSDGRATKTSPGIVNVSSGGKVRNAGVYEYGELQVSGAAEQVFIFNAGEVTVSAGAAVSGITVDDGGILNVEAGGKLTGQIRLEEATDVSFGDGAVLDFDLTQTGPGADALVNDLSVIRGTPKYTITIDGTEKEGKYKLAGCAKNFDKTISVVNTSGTELGTLTVGAATEIAGVQYRLKLKNAELFVTVGEPLNGPDNGWNDYLYDKSNKDNPWCPAFLSDSYVPNAPEKPGEGLFLDEIGTVDYDDEKGHHYDNFVGRIDSDPKYDGRKDASDYAKIELDSAAGLKFMVDSAINGKFNIYQVICEDDGVTPKKVKALISNGGKAVRKNNIAKSTTAALRLEAGTYYISMTGTIAARGDTGGFYNVFLSFDSRFYDDADDNVNDYAYARTGKGTDDKYNLNPELVNTAAELTREYVGRKFQVDEAQVQGKNVNWVGFSDATDYRMFTLDSAALLSFNLSADDKAKLVVYEAKQGKSGKWTLTSKASVTVNGTTVTSKSTAQKVLEKGKYFVMVSSTNATSGLGGNAYYNVTINKDSVFYDSADKGDNDWAYNKKATPQINPNLQKTTLAVAGDKAVQFDNNAMTLVGLSNFVGHNDKVDYARVNVASGTADVVFMVESTGDATLAVYQLAGTRLKKLDTLKVTVGEANATQTLSLSAGVEYFLSMTAKDAKKGNVYYNVTATVFSLNDATADALAMPEPDTLAMTDSLAVPEIDSLGISDALSFGSYDTDALADASASSLAELDDKSTWQNIASLA
jgi:autotransporter passenger strand-loop-strand repeat protein